MNNDQSDVLNAISARLAEAEKIIITTHVNPDGDAIGSALGLWHWVQGNGKNALVVLPNAAPGNLRWMPGAESMTTFGPGSLTRIAEADLIVVLDLNTLTRLGELGERIASSGATVINIDHHTHPQDFAHLSHINIEACSTCAMVTELIIDIDGAAALTPEMSTCLYTGIMTDTGSFRFPRTDQNVLRLAATLVEQGADPVVCYDEVMNQSTFGRTRLLGTALASMELHANGRLCVMSVRRRDLLETLCSVDDVEGFVHHTLSIAGVEMGILFVEVDGEVKCSFRSKGNVHVRDLAATFGGGGHVHAAGARLRNRDYQTVVDQVTTAAVSSLGQ